MTRYDNIIQLIPSKFNVAFKIDLVKAVYYFKVVFHLLCDKSVTPAEPLLYIAAA